MFPGYVYGVKYPHEQLAFRTQLRQIIALISKIFVNAVVLNSIVDVNAQANVDVSMHFLDPEAAAAFYDKLLAFGPFQLMFQADTVFSGYGQSFILNGVITVSTVKIGRAHV